MKLSSILIVDDSENDRYLLKRFVRKTGLAEETVEACDGDQALKYLTAAEQQPGLIFLDINMPKMGGFEFLEKYKDLLGEQPLASVVMFSSSDLDEEKRRASEYPFVRGCMLKMPESAEALRIQVESCLKNA